ncbi:unnamed protein product [Brassica napus]|uniref:(rape) hypothetical protein n=1 Tax=Brassica napus TaxID=3708 RepID=A0A816ILV0_BRANA|nr:unnamed protein product [Brassica napus]
MVNLAVALRSSMCIIVKSAGLVPHTVETEPGTKVNFWLPKNSGGKPEKPAVLLIHGFAGDGVMTWAFQARSLSKRYSVYIPDLLFFGGSYTDKPDRSPEFQAECMVKAMSILGVDKFVLVGFSCGGVVASKIAELYGNMVKALMTMFTNRKEMAELLEALIINNDTTTLPSFPQRIDLLWGENDLFFSVEFAKDLQRKLGEMTSMESIKNGESLDEDNARPARKVSLKLITRD